jgi:peptidyl-prolyl cis-trans isomerase C
MTRALAATGIAVVLALSGCKPTPPGVQKTGPAVAQGDGVVVTVAEFKARLDEQSPFLRQRYQNLDRKKEFLDSLVKFEVLAKAAEKEGLQNDPDVQLTMKKAMVQKLVQKKFGEGDAKDVSDADVQKFYDEHKDDFVKAPRVRATGVLVAASDTDRAQKGAQARKLAAQLKVDTKKDPQAIATLARSSSDDVASKAAGGDMGFRSEEEYAKQYGPVLAAAVFSAKDGEDVVVETPTGFWILRVTGRQEGVTRTVDQVKPQIQSRLQREKRTKEFDEYVKRLRDEAKITVNEAELEKVAVSAAPPGGMPGGMPAGMPGAMPPGASGMPPPARPMPPPGAAPAPAPAPAQK